MTKNRSPESVIFINYMVLVLTPPRVQFTFAGSAFYLLVFILPTWMRFTLAHLSLQSVFFARSAVCIVYIKETD